MNVSKVVRAFRPLSSADETSAVHCEIALVYGFPYTHGFESR
jgi:hypothetical protein